MRFERKSLARWCLWFFVGQVFLFWLVGFMYLPTMPKAEWGDGTQVFVIVSYLAHLGILAIAPALFFVLLAFFLPWRRLIISLAVIFATLSVSLLFSDAVVYNSYQFHMNGTIFALAFHGIAEDVLGLSFFEKALPFLIVSIFLIIEWFYGKWLWHRFSRSQFLTVWFQCLAGISFLVICLALGFIYFNMGHYTTRAYIEKTRFLPLYVEFLGTFISKNNSNLALLRIEEKNPAQWIMTNKTLAYPKKPLALSSPKTPMNLVMVVIDTWRFDMLNEEVTPNLFAFSNKSWVFSNHFSGGNSTLPGIFSLFYGLPATYLSAMEAEHRGPLLLDVLMQQGYQMGIFSSAPLYTPPMNKSIFQSIKNLTSEKQPANNVLERDQLVANHFNQFIQNRNKNEPFFTFLFFDAAHSYCGSDDMPGPFQPVISRCNRFAFNKKTELDLYLNRYKNAVHSIDQKISEVIHTLERENLLDNTIVMIVGDHGEEFDDSDKGFFGHGSNFSKYQVQTPLILYWPNESPKKITYQTSHFDVAPTLLTKMFGCQNAFADYSVGTELLKHSARPYFVVSSYVNFGVIEREKITTIYAVGDYKIEKLNDKAFVNDNVSQKVIRQVYDELQRFYEV